MSPGWSTSWMEAANNAAVISNGVNTDCNRKYIIYDTLLQKIYTSFFMIFHDFSLLSFMRHFILVNGIFVKLKKNKLLSSKQIEEKTTLYEHIIQTSSAGVLSRV